MDRRVRPELWTVPRGESGTGPREAESHVVNGGPRRDTERSLNHAQDLKNNNNNHHHHPLAFTHPYTIVRMKETNECGTTRMKKMGRWSRESVDKNKSNTREQTTRASADFCDRERRAGKRYLSFSGNEWKNNNRRVNAVARFWWKSKKRVSLRRDKMNCRTVLADSARRVTVICNNNYYRISRMNRLPDRHWGRGPMEIRTDSCAR